MLQKYEYLWDKMFKMFKYDTNQGKYYMIESILFRAGDQVIHIFDESLDILTIVKVDDRDAVCFENDFSDQFSVALEDLEPLRQREFGNVT